MTSNPAPTAAMLAGEPFDICQGKSEVAAGLASGDDVWALSDGVVAMPAKSMSVATRAVNDERARRRSLVRVGTASFVWSNNISSNPSGCLMKRVNSHADARNAFDLRAMV